MPKRNSGSKTEINWKPVVEYQNVVGKINIGQPLDMRKLITAGAQHDMGFPGVRFDYGHITVKAYPVGTMVVYGAKTRDAMWTSLSRLLDMLELECRREDLHVFLVVARANLKINIKEIKDIVIKSLSKSYDVWYESTMEIPEIMLQKWNTTSSIMAKVYMNGMMTCEAESEKVAESVIIDVQDTIIRAIRDSA